MSFRTLIAALGSVALLSCSSDEKPAADGKKPGKPPVPVSVETVRTRDMPQLTASMGTVQSLHDVTVRTQVEGVLTEINFKEGQTVKRGDLLARIDDRVIAADVAEAKAEKRKNEAMLQTARIDLVRYENLLKQEAVSKQAIDQQAASVEQLVATVAANDAAIDAATARLSYTRIVSPVDGRVGLRRVDPGNLVRPSDEQGLVNVTQLHPISVIFNLSQDLLPMLQEVIQKHADAPVIALDRPDGDKLAQGSLQMIDNQIDRTTGTITLKAQFANDDEKLWPGQSVAIQLQTGFIAGATVINAKSVQRGMKGPFVYRVKADKAELVPVKVGFQYEQDVVILEGLAPGDVVVSDGHSRVVPGGPVKAVGAEAAKQNVAQGG